MKKHQPTAGLQALAVYFPETVRTNDHWRERHGDLVRGLEEKSRRQVWEADAPRTLFAEEMQRYRDDVFRGSVERRVMADDETTLAMEARVARRALRAAHLSATDIDAVLLTSFFPDQLCVGNGAFLARELDLTCPVWNLESACGSPVASLLLAASLVESGRAKRVLIVLSCAYARAVDEAHPMSWTSGDGAAAMIVGEVEDGFGITGSKVVNTKETCDFFVGEAKAHPHLGQVVAFAATRQAGRLLEEASERCVPLCCQGALDDAGKSLADMDFVVLPTPTAWFSSFACKKLGIDPAKTIDTHARLSNVGPVLSPANLYYAAREGRLAKGDDVLFFAIGSVSSAGALVMKWGDVAVADETDP